MDEPVRSFIKVIHRVISLKKKSLKCLYYVQTAYTPWPLDSLRNTINSAGSSVLSELKNTDFFLSDLMLHNLILM